MLPDLRFPQKAARSPPPPFVCPFPRNYIPLILCTWYLVPWSLYQSALRIVNLLPAEDEDLAVNNHLRTLYIVPLYILYSLSCVASVHDVASSAQGCRRCFLMADG